MPIHVKCPSCSTVLQLPDASSPGSMVRCPKWRDGLACSRPAPRLPCSDSRPSPPRHPFDNRLRRRSARPPRPSPRNPSRHPSASPRRSSLLLKHLRSSRSPRRRRFQERENRKSPAHRCAWLCRPTRSRLRRRTQLWDLPALQYRQADDRRPQLRIPRKLKPTRTPTPTIRRTTTLRPRMFSTFRSFIRTSTPRS